MANLIEYIQSQVYENSTEDISGSIMQQVLTRMASDEGVVNVHTISGQTPFADYNNAQAARDAVPAGFKKLGLIITYKLSSGWYIDEFIGSATSGWSTASNWKCLGPISVSQNASTGKTTITIGSQSYDVATQPVSVSQITETNNPVANALVIGNQEYDIQDARTSGIIGVSGEFEVTANENFRVDTIQIIAGYSYTLKIKSSAVIDLVAITSDNEGDGIRYYWNGLDEQEQIVTFVAAQSIVLQIWSAASYVPNDTTITWEIAFSKVVEDKFEIINKAYQYGYLDANGDFQPNDNFISSPFVDISDCTKIKFNVGDTPYNNASFNLIHYYDENKSHISTPDIHTITTDEIIAIPASARYVRYFVHTGYGFDLYGNTDKNTSTILYVGNTPQCDYTTIQDAIDNCNDSEENPVTIILLGGTYEPFTMRLPNQTPGTYAAMDRHISIIGIDKTLCKVVSTSGEYWKPCAEIGTTGVIANISFIHTATSLVSGGNAYAVHLDWPTDGRKETFKDCYFESNVGAAFGLGLHQDETVEFVNCTFIRTEGYGDDLGAFFGHLSSSSATNQNLIFKCCSIKNNITTSGSHPAISLSGTGSNGKRLFQNTVCKNVNGPSENILGNWENDDMSFNNIPTILNA